LIEFGTNAKVCADGPATANKHKSSTSTLL